MREVYEITFDSVMKSQDQKHLVAEFIVAYGFGGVRIIMVGKCGSSSSKLRVSLV